MVYVQIDETLPVLCVYIPPYLSNDPERLFVAYNFIQVSVLCTAVVTGQLCLDENEHNAVSLRQYSHQIYGCI